MKTHVYTIEYLLHFLLIMVSFLTYLFIFTPDKHYWSPSHTRHNFLTSIIKVKTQTRFMVLFTSGSSLTWGNLQALHLASPQVFTCYLLLTIDFSHLYRDYMMTEFTFLLARKTGGVTAWWLFGVISTSAPTWTIGAPISYLRRTTFHQLPKNLGGHSGAP